MGDGGTGHNADLSSESTDPGPVNLRSERVHLAPLRPDDYPFLYWLAHEREVSYRWRYRAAPPPYELFIQQLHADILVQFVVRRSTDGERIGHVVAYAADLRNGFAFIANTVAPNYIGQRLGGEAQNLFIEFLFDSWSFRKLYSEIPEFTFAKFGSLVQSGGFVVEGHLKDHTYYKGRYWDQYIVAVTRDGWENRRLRLA